MKALIRLSNFIQTIEKRQGLKIACLELFSQGIYRCRPTASASQPRWRKMDMVNTCYGYSLRSLMCDPGGICEQKEAVKLLPWQSGINQAVTQFLFRMDLSMQYSATPLAGVMITTPTTFSDHRA